MQSDEGLSINDARRRAVTAQGLRGRNDSVFGVLHRIGLFQMDPLTRVARAPVLTCAARLPAHTAVGIKGALWPTEKAPAVFETYTHAACVMPIELWPLFEGHRARARSRPDSPPADVRKRVRELVVDSDHGRTIRELQHDDHTGRGWGWSTTRRAAEHMVWRGELACTARRNGERVLDLPERAVPSLLLGISPTPEACVSSLVARALDALAVATTEDVAAYYNLPLAQVADALNERGYARVPIEGWAERAWALDPPAPEIRDDRPRLIGPFDNLIRDRERTRRLFDFDYMFEAYKPAARRTFGAYVLAVLVGDNLVARVDVHRDGLVLVLNRIFTEQNHDQEWCRSQAIEATRALAVQLDLECDG